jgi:acetoin utilization deacetylase AcuC-like enzyme
VTRGITGGVYREVFERIVEPAARQWLHSGEYEWMTSRMVATSDRYAAGRLLMTHEGGYALGYSSLCFARILEALTGERT